MTATTTNEVCIASLLEYFYLVGWIDLCWQGMKIWWGGSTWGDFFLVLGIEQFFGGKIFPQLPTRKKPGYEGQTCYYIFGAFWVRIWKVNLIVYHLVSETAQSVWLRVGNGALK